MTMTLKSIPATLRKLAEARPEIQKDWADLTSMADALDAHLTQPAQAVDVGAIREVLADMKSALGGVPGWVPVIAKLTAALPKDSNGAEGV